MSSTPIYKAINIGPAVGAEFNQNCIKLDADLKYEVDQFMKKLKRDLKELL